MPAGDIVIPYGRRRCSYLRTNTGGGVSKYTRDEIHMIPREASDVGLLVNDGYQVTVLKETNTSSAPVAVNLHVMKSPFVSAARASN